MKKPQKNTEKSYVEKMKEAAAKYGVQITLCRTGGIRAIGILGEIRRNDQVGSEGQSPTDSAGGDFECNRC